MKLTNHTFSYTADDGQKFEFNSEIHVCREGEFSCTVPEEMVPILQQVAVDRKGNTRSWHTAKLTKNYRAYAPTKAELLGFVDAAHRELHRVDVIQEFLICYDTFAEVSYFVRPDGTICENGAAPDAGYGNGGMWATTTMRSGRFINGSGGEVEHYSVGMYAAIYLRKTYMRSTGNTVKFERVYSSHGLPEGMHWARRLNGFCGLSKPRDPVHMQHLPLTDEAAKFFFDSMMAMCEIGRKFKTFFGDQQNVIAAIEGRGPSLLAGPASSDAQLALSAD